MLRWPILFDSTIPLIISTMIMIIIVKMNLNETEEELGKRLKLGAAGLLVISSIGKPTSC